VQRPRSVEGSRQEGEIRLSEFLSSPQQAHDDKEISIGKKSTPDFRHRDRIRHGGDNGYGKDADRETGGPRYLLHGQRNRYWIHRCANAVPRRGGVGKEHPSRQVKGVQRPRSVEGSRQRSEIRLGELLPPPEQAHGDKEMSIGKKRTPEFRHRDITQRAGDDG
jgi:hypothetical protein